METCSDGSLMGRRNRPVSVKKGRRGMRRLGSPEQCSALLLLHIVAAVLRAQRDGAAPPEFSSRQ
ncbi:hypothetical protein EYF80_019495 [Liparis tanakae]|uniref:Uncharacterized protein n=1 Tax=Liparis tanakae TaxID=230148 RepID=A0A4Z2HXI3_9TELE|nr:hypothetical protein EYF80_019495 [Liparis tanakae]